MGEIVFKVGALRNALAKLAKVTGCGKVPLLDTVLIAPDGFGQSALTTTDLDAEMRIAVPSTGATEPFCVPVRPLRHVLGWLPVDEMVRLRPSPVGTGDARCLIDLPDGRARLLVLPADEWPDIMSGHGEWGAWFDLDCAAMIRLLPFVCAEETRYYLNGVALQQDEHGLGVVSTDGHRCGFQTLGPRGNEPGDWTALLPRKLVGCSRHAAWAVCRIGRDCGSGCHRMVPGCAPLRIEIANEVMQLRSRLIDGAFPDWRKMTKAATDTEIRFDRDAMLAAARRLAVMAQGQSCDFRIVAGEDGRLIGSASTAETVLTTRLPGEAGLSFSVGFNARYFFECLTFLPPGPVTWRFDSRAPRLDGVNVPNRFDGDGRSVLLMPMRLRRAYDGLDLGEAA